MQKIYSGLNEDDEEVEILELTNGAGTKEVSTESKEIIKSAKAIEQGKTVGVETGDAIMMSLNKNGEINNINVVYRPKTDTFYPNNNPNAGSDYLAVLRIGLWKVFYKTDNYLRVVNANLDLSDKKTVDDIYSGITPVENLEIANVFVYEPNEKVPYRPGTVGEIRDYYSSKMASRVLSRTNDASTRLIVIYK